MNNLEDIKNRLAAATPGPWEVASGSHPYRGGDFMQVEPDKGSRTICEVTDQHEGNGNLIAHAPEDIAYLLAEVESLRATNSRLNRRAQIAEAAVNAFQNDDKREGLRNEALIREYYTRAEEARAELARRPPEAAETFTHPTTPTAADSAATPSAWTQKEQM